MPDTISAATTPGDYAAFAGLVREYVEWCRRRYQDDAWFVDQAFSHQSLDRELETLSVSYGPPNGRTFLARREDEVCGCGAYRKLSNEACEMKRLFVPDRFRGKGTGRKLCDSIIQAAKGDDFKVMRLDTGNLLTEAIVLYESIGFHRCPPYNHYPEKLMSYIVFMEMPLAAR